jgi:predicted nuclease with RNAse H fold
MANTRTRLDKKEFVMFWQKAPSLEAVCEHFNVEASQAMSLANRLRAQGVKSLKVFPRAKAERAAINYDELAELADSLLGGDDSAE